MKMVDENIFLMGDDLEAYIHAKPELKGGESAIDFGHTSNSAIDPEDVIAWLVTQPNANGTLYLENVVRKYMSALRIAPAKLHIPVVFNSRSVFTCHTPDELNAYWEICRAAPNYKQVNSSTSGMFSAGMACYMRFLDHVADKLNAINRDVAGFTRPELCDRTCTLAVQMCPSLANVVPATPPKPALDPELIEKLTDVLSAHFPNGYRLNSHIEFARFKSFAAEDFGEEIVLSHEELKTYILASGTTYDGKVYAVSAETQEQIIDLVKEYFSDGAQAIFFAEFYAKNENWLFEASVVSEDLLVEILRKLFPKLSFTQTYFGYTDASIFVVLEGEILRVWGDDVLLNYAQLAERLRYVPFERIMYALSQNRDFIWNSVETFSHITRIEITDEERQVIREAALRECNSRGYVSITDFPFEEIEERNHGLSFTAVHNAVYRICLSDKFDIKGKIVTRKGDTLDALTIMKNYCRNIEKCSLDDLLNYEKELTGEVHGRISMEAGNTVLVRIDKDSYVADKFVHFDVIAIDDSIELFVEGDYLPLKSFTTFGAFPHCDQAWNLFLLESYCRRFSRKFRFDAASVNSRNAGAVIRKRCGMDYTEIMTDAVANADIHLTDIVVGKFLYESGFTGRRTTAKANEIINKAKAMRERMD